MGSEIRNIRKDYTHAELDISNISLNPFTQFNQWLDEALRSEVNEPTAMTLSTISPENQPTSRIVLLKEVNDNSFVFFTNYNSEKGQHISHCPFVCLNFFWSELERQVRIEGIAKKISDEESDTYFKSRPLGSQIGAWASPQSKVIESRKVLEDNVIKYTELFKEELKRPVHWGGYMVEPEKIEFWQGRSSRLHDRIRYTRKLNSWLIDRLAP